MSRRKNGQSPFETGTSKTDTQLHKDDAKQLKTNAVLHLTQLGDAKVSKPPKGFIKPVPKGAEPTSLPTKRIKGSFDPNAYKLMSKAGYDFSSFSNLEKNNASTVKERHHTETKKKLKEHGYGVDNNKTGLGFTPNTPMKISRKTKNVSAQHISVSVEPAPRTLVFNRLNRSKPRISTLDRIGDQDQTSIFKRLNTPTPHNSIFERLSKPKKQSNTALERLEETKKPSRKRKTTPKEEKLDDLAEDDDVRSSIPSWSQTTLEVDIKGLLKVRRRTIIHTSQSSCQQAQEDGTEEEVQDVFHITIQEDQENEIPEEDVIATPSQLKDGGQTTVDDLKELNLGISEE